jgi:hypothetical protein
MTQNQIVFASTGGQHEACVALCDMHVLCQIDACAAERLLSSEASNKAKLVTINALSRMREAPGQ